MMTPQDSFVIENVKVFDGYDFFGPGFVVVREGVIDAVGCGQLDVSAYPELLRISRPGKSLIPGLIDAHIHAIAGNVNSIEQSLRFGVTTVCDMHNELRHNVELTKLSRNRTNKAKFSDFKCAGIGANTEGGWPVPVLRKELESVPHREELLDQLVSSWPKIRAPEDAAPFVRLQIEEHGASYIKIFHELGDTLGMDLPHLSTDVRRAIVDAAHDAGKIVVGHALSHSGAMDLLEAGVDGLTHIFLDEPPNDRFVQSMLSRKVHCSPTLSLCASQTSEKQEWQEEFGQDSFAHKMLIGAADNKPLGLAKEQHPAASVEHAYKTTRALYRAGVTIIVGSDAAGQGFGVPYGLGVHIEMHLLARHVGMTPRDVLRAATSATAERFGFRDRGELTKGRNADLVLTDGDIEAFLLNAQSRCLPIEGVWRDGILANVFEEDGPQDQNNQN
ncbi:hypothetical protein HJFPF1_08446 [Paramyrothecium foliicola]|nr:hypothetical protein HJFPF1_08446 [Paramyrothecium foliicola]